MGIKRKNSIKLDSNGKKKFNIYELFNLVNFLYFGAALIIGLFIFVLYCLFNNFSLYNSCNGLFIGASVVIFIGLMDLILIQGTFDIIAVGFANLFSVFRKDGVKKYDGTFEYAELKSGKRKEIRFRWIFIFTAGLILLACALILLAIFNSTVAN